MSTKVGFHTLDISRRGFLRSATLVAGAGIVLGAIAVTPAAAGSKFSQKAALYQPTPKGAQNCGNCVQFEPATACKVVDGTVATSGWCMLYSPKK
jgi:High potential iron-sulfur protein